MLSLNCSCDFHKITIEALPITTESPVYEICIWQHKSFTTGKEFKKPILKADVVLTEEQFKILKNYE